MATEPYVHPTGINESTLVGAGTRIWAYAHILFGARVGKDCNIGDHAFVEGGAELGNGVTVKNSVAIWEGVVLEDYVFVGPNVSFTNDRFPRSPRNPVVSSRYDDKGWLESTRVRVGASLGANATIVCGLTVGRYSTVAAGAVVTRDVPDFSLVMGVPGRVVGHVCMCGMRLSCSQNPICTVCGRQYRQERQSLKFVEESCEQERIKE